MAFKKSMGWVEVHEIKIVIRRNALSPRTSVQKTYTKVGVDLKDVLWPKAIFAKGGTFRLRDQSAKTLEIVDAIFNDVS